MRIFLALAAVSCLLLADEAPKGVPARPAASDYAAEAQWQHVTFAASLVPSKQVEHLFAFDISKSFVVFEVACYAESADNLKISRDGFVVKVNASGYSVHNSEPGAVASAIQRQNLPSMPSSHNAQVMTGATIGIAHGPDPYSGRPTTNVYTAGQVGVEEGGPDMGSPQPRDPKPGGTSEDRVMLEAQLRARSLPEGAVNHAVAGYIFFRKSDLKAQKDGTYALQYLADDDSSGATHAVTLTVPKKER